MTTYKPSWLVYVNKKHTYKPSGSEVQIGHEVTFGAGDYGQYVAVEKIVPPSDKNPEGLVHLRMAGRRSVVKVTPKEIGAKFKTGG